MANLEGLSVYWNSQSIIISQLESKTLMLDKMQEFVDKEDAKITHGEKIRIQDF
jgi:hypothetical protein